MMPDFFIVGAPRCGTTAMYEQLRAHPDVFMPYRKEPLYFGSDLHRRPPVLTREQYLSLFAPANPGQRVGEASVWYLYSSRAPEEIRQAAPEARIIVMLRDPVEMLASLHGLLLLNGHEEITDFAAALAAEPDRAEGRRIPPGCHRPEGLLYRRCVDYAPFVRRYQDVFGADRVLVVLFDDFRADATATYRRVLEFLEVDPTFEPEVGVVNPSKRVRSRRLQRVIDSGAVGGILRALPMAAGHRARKWLVRRNSSPAPRTPVAPELRARLIGELEPAIAGVEELVGRPLPGWRAER